MNAVRSTTARILEGALDAVARYGPRRLSMATIAEQAGVCRGTLYRHFETREQLLDSMATHLVTNFATEIERATRDTTTPHERIIATIDYHRRFADRPRTRQLRELQPAFVLSFLQSVFTELRALTEHTITPAFDATSGPLALGPTEFADLATRVLFTNCVLSTDRPERASAVVAHCWDLPAGDHDEESTAGRARTRATTATTIRSSKARRSVEHRILEGAIDVLARSGGTRPSISDVAEAARVSRGTVYRYFPNRDTLLAALADHIHEGFEHGFDQALTGAPTARERVRAGIAFNTAYASQHEIGRLQELQPEFAVRFITERFDDLVAIQRRAVDGSFPPGARTHRGPIDADDVAEVFARAFISLSLATPGRSDGLPAALLELWDGLAAVPAAAPTTGLVTRATVPASRPSVGPRAAVGA